TKAKGSASAGASSGSGAKSADKDKDKGKPVAHPSGPPKSAPKHIHEKVEGKANKQLFEYQQGLLLESTEQLQDIMESNNMEKLLDMRKDILNKSASIDKFRAEMVKQVERG